MVSTMTFRQVVRTYAKYRQNRGLEDHTAETAKSDLLTWLELGDDEEPAIPREVGIVLASEDFSQEITTTVLWLNEFHAFDIRCVRLTPYKLGKPRCSSTSNMSSRFPRHPLTPFACAKRDRGQAGK